MTTSTRAAPGRVDPWAGRKDGLCPSGAPMRKFNLVSLQLPIQTTAKGQVDEGGRIFALAKDKKKILPPSLGGTGEKSHRAAGHPRQHRRLHRAHADVGAAGRR